MALRPTELQIILSATRDIEKLQHIQQQLPRSHQEYLAIQFQREMEERKRQTQSLAKTEQGQVKKIETEEEKYRRRRQERRQTSSNVEEEAHPVSKSEHIIDLLI